jgi:hypothetical protein
VYGLHHVQGDEKHEFLDLASKPRTTVSSSLALKPVAMVLVFLPQNHSLRFLGFSLKISSYGLVIWPTKSPRQFLGLGLKTKWSSGLLRLEASQARVFQSSFKTGGGMTWMVYVASSRRPCGEMKPKTDGSMQWAASDSSTPTLLFLLY